MEPVRIRVTEILDFGKVISVIGIDLESQKQVVVHVDHRPWKAVMDSWRTNDLPAPVSFGAVHLTLSLEMSPDEPDGDGGHRVAA